MNMKISTDALWCLLIFFVQVGCLSMYSILLVRGTLIDTGLGLALMAQAIRLCQALDIKALYVFPPPLRKKYYEGVGKPKEIINAY